MLKSSFPPVVRPDARLLVLGSLPGERSLAAQRYYAHPQNQFWSLMTPVVERDLVALGYSDRLLALQDAGIALWDVVASARRDGSSDAAIRDHRANDLPALVARLPLLRAVAFNGAKAAAIGTAALGAKPAVELVTLPSSSPLHTVGIAGKQPAWDRLRAFLG